MPEIVADPLLLSRCQLFLKPEMLEYQCWNLNDLVLIPFCLAGATRAGALPGEAPTTRGAGRAALPTPGGACPTSSPGH
jgi:hypothetical protein